jgi:hypothetical protein
MISEDALASLRAMIVTAEGSFRGSLDYAVTAPALVDPVIREVMNGWSLTSLPKTEPRRGNVLHALRSAYAAAQKTPAWLAEIEKAIERRFAAPRVREQGDLVDIDYGQAPGKLEVRGRKGVVVAQSPLLENDQWRTAELARALSEASAAYPRAQRIRLRIQTEDGTYPRQWVYDYDRKSDAILVSFPARPYELYLSPRLGLNPRVGTLFDGYLSGERSLKVADLRAVRR